MAEWKATQTPHEPQNFGGNMKKAWVVLAAILFTALIAGGSFWAGMAHQTNQVDQARLSFESARGQMPGGQIPQGGAGFPTDGSLNGVVPASPGGRGTTGQVKAIDGNVMTLSTAQDVTTVNLTSDTKIRMTVDGSRADLTPGLRIMVSGESDGDGAIIADQITILDSSFTGPSDGTGQLYPPASGMEP
jgi:hypothetical protein